MRVALFLEDVGHERFIASLVRRLADEARVPIEVDVRNASGGASQLDDQFIQFLRGSAVANLRPDLVVVVRDTDCTGVGTVKARYSDLVKKASYAGDVVVGAPEPHVECWYLADPPALQRVLHGSTQAPVPDSRCGRGRFKQLLSETVKEAGVVPLLGGIEYAEGIVTEMDVYKAAANVPSLHTFIGDLRQALEAVPRSPRKTGL